MNQHRKQGDVVWPFRIQSVLGEGAMGEVYLAEHITDKNLVALKFMPTKLRGDAVLAARFRREMKVLQELRHPNIVRCLFNLNDNDEKTEHPYYAMEFVDGGTFDDLLRLRVRMPLGQALHYAVQMLGALSAAHNNGIVHRDVKPSNFLVSKDRKALKLCDFGLAMVLGGTQLTRPGQTMGTPWYMSPEQIRGETSVSGASDLYAMGCILMEVLTGKPPFVGDTHFAILNQHLGDEPPLVSSRVPDIKHAVFADRLVSQLLEKDPAKRPANAGDVIAEIGAVMKQPKQSSARKSAIKKARPESHERSRQIEPESLLSDSDPGGGPKLASPGAKVAWARGMDAWQRIRSRKATFLALALLVSLTVNILMVRNRPPELSEQDRLWLTAIPNHSVRKKIEASAFLCLLSDTNPATLDVLERLLDDAESEVRGNAALAVAHLGPDGIRFRPKIRYLAKHDDSPSVRKAASEALQCLNGDAPPRPLN